MTRVLNSPEYTQLRRQLARAREEKGLTQADLAAALGRTQSFVSKYELGERRLDVIDFLLVCQQLQIDAADLISRLERDRSQGRRR